MQACFKLLNVMPRSLSIWTYALRIGATATTIIQARDAACAGRSRLCSERAKSDNGRQGRDFSLLGSTMHILIVDDESTIRKSLRIALESMQHTVDEAASAKAALELFERAEFDLALVDLRLGQESGFNLLENFRARSPRVAVVIVTAYSSIDSAVDAMRRGAFDYLAKPFTPAQIRAVLERYERDHLLQNRLAGLEEQVSLEVPEASLSGGDHEIEAVLEQARRIAATDAPVLIRGESGTGKGVLARAIHAWSRRAAAPFVTVSSPSLNADLLESALFGHARGSFTGAVTDTEGKVAAAQGGTLFLDEIGDLPLILQPKLLRFVQEHRYERVGETRTRAADIRLITATNHDLDAAITSGRFREDLLFRLNVIEMTLPPLRQRADLLELAEYFVAFFARRLGKKLEGFSEDARSALVHYHWPGNLRELRNAIERAAIFARDSRVQANDLPGRIAQTTPLAGGGATGPIAVGLPVTLEQLEAEHIRLVLERSPTREDAARVLGIDPSTLYRKRKQLGL
jgi:NtrC-family two-component system response regulator AlgB